MKKLFMLFSLLFVCLLSSSVEAQWRPPHPRPRPQPGPNPGPQPGPGYGRQNEAQAFINRSFRGRGIIDLNYELDLDRRFSRQRVREIIIIASSEGFRDRGSGQARLLSANRPFGWPANIGTYRQQYSLTGRMERPQELGRDIYNLQIEVYGDVFVEQVLIRFDEFGPGPGPGDRDVLMQRINQVFRGGADLDLNRILGLHMRRDPRRIEAVIVVARTTYGGASVQAVVNNMTASYAQLLDPNIREFRLFLQQNNYDRFQRDLRLLVRGDAEVEAVGVKFSNF